MFRVCVERLSGNVCPVCGIPSHHRDIQINRRMDLATSLCQRLSALLSVADSDRSLVNVYGNLYMSVLSNSINSVILLVICVRTILVLGYWALGNIHRCWILLLLGNIFFIVTPNTIPIRQQSAAST